MSDIRAIVFGTSYGVTTHVRALRAVGVEVSALVGRDPRTTRERADYFQVEHAFTDVDEALALPGVQLVAVATPPHTHAPITLAAVAAGKHVLCEKPFALDSAEARAMLDAARRAGIVHALGAEFRFTTHQATLRRVVRSGAIGQPRNAIFVRQMPSLVDPDVELSAWWESEAQGGGWLGAYGSHVIDQVRVTLGEFDSVTTTLDRIAKRPTMTADDTFVLQFRLATGCTGVIHSSCSTAGNPVNFTKISGTDGAAWLQPCENGEEVWVDTGSGPERVPDPGDLPRVPLDPPPSEMLPESAKTTKWHANGSDLAPYTRLYEDVRSRIAGEPGRVDPPLATFGDGVALQAVLDAARRSAAERAWVRLPAPPEG